MIITSPPLPFSAVWRRSFQLGLAIAFCSRSTFVSSSSTSPTNYPLLRNGGGLGPSRRWSATPVGIRTTPTTTTTPSTANTYPTVQDLDNDTTANTKEDTKDMIDAFLTRDSRNKFISRVYTILSGQLLVTAFSILLFGTIPNLGLWMRVTTIGRMVPLLSLLLSTAAWIFACTSVRARREAPIKWQLLTLFTVGEAVAVGFITSMYTLSSVLTAMSATAVATLSISAYTLWNNNPTYDLSQWGAGLSSCGMIFLVYGVIHLLELTGVLPQGFLPFREGLYSFLGACLFSAYLAYHTKLIVAGKHSKYQMNEKDYIFGAMSLYNDIINMFIYILRVIGEDRDRGTFHSHSQ